HGLQPMLHRGPGGHLGGGLSGERRGLLAATETLATGGGPGDGVALGVGDGHHGVVEGRTDMDLALFDVLLFTAAADNLLASLRCSHCLFPLLTSSCWQWSSSDPCGCGRWSCCADRGQAARGGGGCPGSSRSR